MSYAQVVGRTCFRSFQDDLQRPKRLFQRVPLVHDRRRLPLCRQFIKQGSKEECLLPSAMVLYKSQAEREMAKKFTVTYFDLSYNNLTLSVQNIHVQVQIKHKRQNLLVHRKKPEEMGRSKRSSLSSESHVNSPSRLQ